MTSAEELEEKYREACRRPGDIRDHLPTLRGLAEKSDVVVELGVRFVCSTWALLAGRPRRLLSYDLKDHPNIRDVERLAEKLGVDYRFIQADTLTIDVEGSDLLFIDTFHSYPQLRYELFEHGVKARRWIVMHDTTTYARKGMDGDRAHGLWNAVEDFLKDKPEWRIFRRWHNNNGLTVLERKV